MKRNSKTSKKRLRVVELFAGVGGFKLGLCSKSIKNANYEVVWANQWEPATKMQHAAIVYRDKFHNGEEPNPYFNTDINVVTTMTKMPVPSHDLLVGGFPCQDYSVARTLSHAKGIEGKKGVLWWSIQRILSRLKDEAPDYLMLENVDRLLKSPAKQRGRDFGIILASLADLGYMVEWRVVNAADYGMPQRRRRVFIIGYKKNSPIFNKAKKMDPLEWLTKKSVTADAFPIKPVQNNLGGSIQLSGSLSDITEHFNYSFENAGFMWDRKFITIKTTPDYSGKKITLGSILLPPKEVPKEYFIDEKELAQWKYLKGAKKEKRSTKDGFSYTYNEGSMTFPDAHDKPSRTIITGEGGSTPSRFKHVVKQGNKYRRLTPTELELLCMFPKNHTKHTAVGDVKRAFFMGNALVVGVIKKLGDSLYKLHQT